MNRPFYSLLLIFIILLSACSSKNEEELSELDNRQKVVLAFELQGALQSRRGMNGLSENNIGRVSIFIFNPTTAEKVYEDSFQAAYAYQVRIKPGTYDFYFIANQEDLPLNTLSRDDLDRRLEEKKMFSGYFGSTTLPMARVYKSQKINSGGTLMNPQKFTPQLSANNPLLPISSYGEDESVAGQISLVRSVAKVSVKLKGEGLPYVTNLEYVQASSEYSLGQLADDNFSRRMVENIPFQKVSADNLSNYAPIYIPERVFSKSEETGWLRDAGKSLDEPIGHVNYIQLTMYGGTMYKIPVVSNGSQATGNYLDFARDGSKADYNVIRNFDYQYTLTVPLANRELQVESVVLPWNVVNSEMSFTKPAIDFQFSGAVADPEALLMNGMNSINFTLKVMNSNGIIWRAALSNGLDFELVPNESSPNVVPAIMGVGSDATTYGFTLRPLKPYQGTPRFTELYLLVNGKEVSFFNNESQVGPGKRLLIKQVQIN